MIIKYVTTWEEAGKKSKTRLAKNFTHTKYHKIYYMILHVHLLCSSRNRADPPALAAVGPCGIYATIPAARILEPPACWTFEIRAGGDQAAAVREPARCLRFRAENHGFPFRHRAFICQSSFDDSVVVRKWLGAGSNFRCNLAILRK